MCHGKLNCWPINSVYRFNLKVPARPINAKHTLRLLLRTVKTSANKIIYWLYRNLNNNFLGSNNYRQSWFPPTFGDQFVCQYFPSPYYAYNYGMLILSNSVYMLPRKNYLCETRSRDHFTIAMTKAEAISWPLLLFLKFYILFGHSRLRN